MTALLLLAIASNEYPLSPWIPKSYLIDGDRWTIGVSDVHGPDRRFAYFKRNGKTVFVRTAEEMVGWYQRVIRVWYPAPWPIFVLACHTGAGHGLLTEFYALRSGEVQVVLQLNTEKGGPIFRDFDGDGVMEWVFDDYHYYTDLGKGPQHFLVYKWNDKGTLSLWKTLDNPKRKHLPMPWYRVF